MNFGNDLRQWICVYILWKMAKNAPNPGLSFLLYAMAFVVICLIIKGTFERPVIAPRNGKD